MKLEEFQKHIARMTSVFGDKSFPEERIKVIWPEVQYLTEPAFSKMCDYFIGEYKTAPTLSQIREFTAKLRETAIERERAISKQEAKDFWACSYVADDKKWLIETMKRRIQGQISDAEYASFQQDLKNIARESPHEKGICKYCDNSGLVAAQSKIDSKTYAFRCQCSIGQLRTERFPTYHFGARVEMGVDTLPVPKDWHDAEKVDSV